MHPTIHGASHDSLADSLIVGVGESRVRASDERDEIHVQ